MVSKRLHLVELNVHLTIRRYRGDETAPSPGGPPPASPIYNSLTTNLPHCIMSYHDFMFPPSTDLYPPASIMQQYLLDFTEHFGLRRFIRLRTRVEDARWNGSEWRIRLSGDSSETRSCDHLIVANGHYHRPYYPTIPGLTEWAAVDGREATHSTYYREPSSFTGKRVLVIGGGPSGRDISTEIALIAAETYHCVRGFTTDDTSVPKKRPGIVSFDPKGEGVVRYVDGTEDRGVNRLVMGTGFEFE